MITLRKFFVLSVTAAALIGISLPGCTGDTTSPNSNTSGGQDKGRHPLTVPSLGNHNNHFFIAKFKAEKNFVEYSDPAVTPILHTTEWSGQSLAYFNDGSATATGLSLNSKTYVTLFDPLYNYTSYSIDDATVHTDGTNNSFVWTRSAPAPWTFNWSTNIGDAEIVNPAFNSNVSKAAGLTITWDSPPAGAPATYAKVEVQGKIDPNAGSGATGGFATSGYIDNVGSYTVPASELSAFTENSARITVTVGTFSEQTFGSETYLFVLTTSAIRDVNLIP